MTKEIIKQWIHFPIVDCHHHLWNPDDVTRPNRALIGKSQNEGVLREYACTLLCLQDLDVLNAASVRKAFRENANRFYRLELTPAKL